MRKIYFLMLCLAVASFIGVHAQYAEPNQTLTVPYLTPEIDGDADDGYSDFVPMKIGKRAGAGVAYEDGDAVDFNAQFKIAWDTAYLYLYVEVTDDVEESMPVGGANAWTWDNMEIFIDLDTNSTTNTYNTASTVQLRYNRGEVGVESPGRSTAADWLTEQINEADGWIVELGIPWTSASAAGVNPDMCVEAGDILGFDIAVADGDGDGTGTEGGRNVEGGAQMFWDLDAPDATGNEDNAYQNRRVFGWITLGTTGAPCTVGVEDQNVSVYGVYPNPSNGVVNFSNLDVKSFDIYNVLGARVTSVQVVNNLASVKLESGIYFAVIKNTTVKVVVK